MKKLSIGIAVCLLFIITGATFLVLRNTETEQPRTAQSTRSLDDPGSSWVVVNKQRSLQPKEYAPSDLVAPNVPLRKSITDDEKMLRLEAARALEQLVAAGKNAGQSFTLQSGYRSYAFQKKLYNRYVDQQGQAEADTQSARPGYSEHQTGLAVDLGGTTNPRCDVHACFADTPEGQWLAANAHAYGFIIRYPEGADAVTGYVYEPWHIRYVGTELANKVLAAGSPPLETYFELPTAASY